MKMKLSKRENKKNGDNGSILAYFFFFIYLNDLKIILYINKGKSKKEVISFIY